MTTTELDRMIQVRAAHSSYEDAVLQADARQGVCEIEPAAALAIAAAWQSPGTVGHVLASFASGAPVSVSDLLRDIYLTRLDVGYVSPRQGVALDMLATFAMNHDGEN